MAPKGSGMRSQARHNFENLGAGALAWFALNRFEDLSTVEKDALLIGGMAILSGLAKFWSSHDIGGRILSKLGLGALVLLMLSGCTGVIGTLDPEEYEGSNGETIVACRIAGFSWAFGAGGTCGTVVGGHVSDVFAGLVTGTLDAAARMAGGFLTGAGAAIIPPPRAPVEVRPPDRAETPVDQSVSRFDDTADPPGLGSFPSFE